MARAVPSPRPDSRDTCVVTASCGLHMYCCIRVVNLPPHYHGKTYWTHIRRRDYRITRKHIPLTTIWTLLGACSRPSVWYATARQKRRLRKGRSQLVATCQKTSSQMTIPLPFQRGTMQSYARSVVHQSSHHKAPKEAQM